MPTLTDWLMVGITAVYVLATFAICWANIKSANASKAQLTEMRKQYNDENRPYIEAELHYERRTWFVLRLINHGKRTAQQVKINLSKEFLESLSEAGIKALLVKQQDKEFIIGIGQHYDLPIGSNKMRGNPNMQPIAGTISYQANGHHYSSDIYIDLENYATFFSLNDKQDDLIQSIKENTVELKGIKQATQKLHEEAIEENDHV